MSLRLLTTARKGQGLTIAQASHAIGVAEVTWKSWENSQHFPRQSNRRAVFNLFGEKVLFQQG